LVILSVILILLIFTTLAALLARLAKKQIGFTPVTIALDWAWFWRGHPDYFREHGEVTTLVKLVIHCRLRFHQAAPVPDRSARSSLHLGCHQQSRRQRPGRPTSIKVIAVLLGTTAISAVIGFLVVPSVCLDASALVKR
jgi:hypothetical protein